MLEYPKSMEEFQVPVIAKVLHDLPHFNSSFQKIDNTFRPNDVKYQESLITWSLIPIVLLIITLLAFLLYLIKQCCQHRTLTTYKSITSLKFIVTIITIICCIVIGLDLYGNEIVHNGFMKFQTATQEVNTLVSRVRNQSEVLKNIFQGRIGSELLELTDMYYEHVEDQMELFKLLDAHNVVQSNVTLAVSYARAIYGPLIGVNMTEFLKTTDSTESLRWPLNMLVLILILLVSIMLLVGLAKHSRFILIMFTVCGLFAIIIIWLITSLYLPSSIAVSDLCINPQEYLVSAAPAYLPINIILDYTQPCKPQHINSFTLKLQESHRTLNDTRHALMLLSQITMYHFKPLDLYEIYMSIINYLNIGERTINELYDLVECKTAHQYYLNAKRAICQESLQGLTLMLVNSIIAAILLTIMVWIAAHNWIYMKMYNKYAEEDVSDNQQEILIALNSLPTKDDNRNLINEIVVEKIEDNNKEPVKEATAPMLKDHVEDKHY